MITLIDQLVNDLREEFTKYTEYNNIINALERNRRALLEENRELKREVRDLRGSIEAAKGSEKEITNVDLLRRISQLEKIVLGKYE